MKAGKGVSGLLLIGFLAALAACGDGGSGATTGGGGGTTGAGGAGGAGGDDTTAAAGGGLPAGCATLVAFADVQSTIFNSCSGYIGCHLKGPFGGGLDLTEGHAYANLVNKPSLSGAMNQSLVAPGDPEKSFLYRKLTGDLAADMSEGVPMPKTGTMAGWAKLPDDQIEMVRCWIAEGAPGE